MTEQMNSQKAANLIESQTGRRCSRQNLEKLCRSGRLPRSCVSIKPIKLNSDTLIDEYLNNVDLRQHRPLAKPVSESDPVELKRAIKALPEDAIPELNESRARREHYQAELAKLQVAQQRKELIAADEVKKQAYQVGRSVREALSNLADRLSHQLAGEVDATRIHQLLTDEHRAALMELTNG